MLETVQSLGQYSGFFIITEWVSVIIFSIEYILRLTVSKKKLSYIFSFWGLIDAVSILPTIFSVINLTFLKVFRDLRILRMLRIVRMGKISRAYLKSHDEVKTQAEFNKINILIFFSALLSMIIIFASVLYAFENAQPEYSNIPISMIQSSKILIGGLSFTAPLTLEGQITIIIGRFIGLALFGLLIGIIGGVLNQLLFGKIEKH